MMYPNQNLYPNFPVQNQQFLNQQIQPQQIPQIPQAAPEIINNIIWVQGEQGAKAYPVSKGSTVALWDSENKTIYVKSTDNLGMPVMQILDWTERKLNQNNIENQIAQNQENKNDFVTRKEFDDVVKRLNNLSNKLNNNSNKQKQNKQNEED